MLLTLLLIVILIAFLSTEYYAFKTGVPTIASFPSARRKVLEVLQKHMGAQTCTILDLGSGNGQLANKIARSFPTATVMGIEISLVPWLFSVLRQRLFGPANLTFLRMNFWTYDCSTTDIIIIFLTENIIDRVSTKLQQELKEGALIIANDTALRGKWAPIDTLNTGLFNMKIFVYRQTKPAERIIAATKKEL